MNGAPKIRPETPGIYQVVATANTDHVLAVPTGAVGLLLWFETSATSAVLIAGRVGIDNSSTAVPAASITGTDNVLGYHPPAALEYSIDPATGSLVGQTWTLASEDAYLHVSGAAGIIARGSWLF